MKKSDAGRFDRFTVSARKALSSAQDEARRFNHTWVGTEHLLLGLLAQEHTTAAIALQRLGVQIAQARSAVEFIVGRGDGDVSGEIGLTPRAKKVMELAVDEARRLGHSSIGTEHLLLGIMREGKGIAANVLTSLGVTLDAVRRQVIRISSGGQEASAEIIQASQPAWLTSGVKSNVVTCRLDDASLSALDALVEAGVRSTRSDAAAWLIAAGIEANRAIFERVNATVSEIRRLRAEAQSLAEQVSKETRTPHEERESGRDGEEKREGDAPES